MARIRTDVPTVSPRVVQTEAAQIPVNTGLGEGIQQLGNFVAQTASKMKAEREELANGAYSTYATTTFQQELQAATLEEQQKGGANYAARIQARAAEIQARIISRSEYTGEQPSDKFLPQVDQQLTRLASSAVTKGLVFEHDYNVNQGLEQVGDARRSAEVLVFDNPNDFEETLEAQSEAIREGYAWLGPDPVKEEIEKFGTELADASIRGYLEQDPGTLLNDLGEGRFDQYLTAERKAQFTNAAQAKLEAARAKAERTFDANTADHLASLAETGQGIDGLSDEAEVAYANNPRKLATFRRRESLALVGYTTKKTLESSGPIAAQNYLDSIAHPPGTIGFADRQKVLSALEGAVGAEAKADIKKLTKDSILRIEALGEEGSDAAELHALEQIFLNEEELTEAKKQREDAYRFNREYKYLLQQDPAEAANYLAETKPGVDAEDYARRSQEWDRIRKVWSNIQEQRAEDPSAYVQRNDVDLSTRRQEMEQAYVSSPDPVQRDAAAKTLQRYDNELLFAQADLGVTNPRLLSNQERKLIALEYERKQDPQAKSDYIDQLSTRYGNNWHRVTRELGKSLPPEAAMAVTMSRPEQSQARVRLLTAAEVGVGTLKSTIGDRDANAVDNEVRMSMQDFNNTVTGFGAATVTSRYQKTVSTLAYEYVRRGDSVQDAVTRATNEVVNDVYEYDGRTRIPKHLDTDRISSVLAQTKDNLEKLYTVESPPSLLAPGLDTTEEYIDSIKDNGYWATNADDTGVFLRDEHGANVFNADGTPVFLSFEETKDMDPTRFYSLTDIDLDLSGASPAFMRGATEERMLKRSIEALQEGGGKLAGIAELYQDDPELFKQLYQIYTDKGTTFVFDLRTGETHDIELPTEEVSGSQGGS